jgi:acid stress-induced BolA-like protein IbaG/YrbA
MEDGGDFQYMMMQKAANFSGTVQGVSEGDIDRIYSTTFADNSLQGDGTSTGSIAVTVNYEGSKTINSQNQIYVAISKEINDDAFAVGRISAANGTVTFQHVPDGVYYVKAYIKKTVIMMLPSLNITILFSVGRRILV